MTSEFVFSLLIFLAIIILFIISKLNNAMKMLNNRVNIHSSLIKRIKREQPGKSNTEKDDILRELIEKDFK